MRDIINFLYIFTTKQKKAFVVISIIMIIGAALESIGIGAILPLISLMGQPDYLSNDSELTNMFLHIGVSNHQELIVVSASILIIFYIIKNLYVLVEMYIQRRIAFKIQVFYAKEILATYLSKPYIFHVNHNTAKLLRDVNSGAIILSNHMLMSVFNMVTEIVTIVAIWIMLILVDIFTAVIVLGALSFIILFIIIIFRGKIIKQGEIQNQKSVEYLKWVNQGLGSIKETKILGKEIFFASEFDKSYKKYAKSVQIGGFITDVPRILIEVLVVGGLLTLIVIKVLIGNSPSEIIPVLGVLAMAAFRLMPSANRIVSYYNSLKMQMPFFYDLYGVLKEIKYRITENSSQLIADNKEILPFDRDLKIENLSFKYSDSKMILDDVSFHIHKGKFIGIVGPSGAGKTTFVDLLLGLLEPTTGRILCDDRDINDNIRGWQSNLAYVPQDIYLIDGSIRENIALGESTDMVDDKLIYKVLDMAELTDYINSLPDGLDTFVGERGIKISGGQRQRIGIARALYQQPKVLILDEATSALDNETEKSITETILKFKGKITIIAIAHRISTLNACDYKVRLENGKAEIIY